MKLPGWFGRARKARPRRATGPGARRRTDAPALPPIEPPRGDIDFAFLFSLNNAGTTVIGRYLEAQTGGYLPPFGNSEGQFAPAVRAHMRARPWDPDHALDWRMIRGAWEALARAEGKTLFIECSPANLAHVDAIRSEFGERARMVFSVADPYAQIASNLFNYATAPLSPEMLAAVARRWIARAEILHAAMAAHPDLARISYEAFCRDPACVNKAFGVPLRAQDGDIGGKKNDPVREIIDLTRRQLAFLSFSEWDEVNQTLAGAEDLITALGYALEPGRALLARAATDPALMHAGLVRRAVWEGRRPARRGGKTPGNPGPSTRRP